jgi:acyl-CoA thioesterase FadM
MTSSTKRFQNDRDTGTEAKALCSTSSITKLAITADTGDPIAVPKNLLIITALNDLIYFYIVCICLHYLL